MNGRRLRWGVLSTASIAREKWIPGVRSSTRSEVVAIASRDAADQVRSFRVKSFSASCLAPVLCSCLVALTATELGAEQVKVDTIAALQKQLAVASPGDTITLANGLYSTSAPLLVNRSGAAGRPITIQAETVSGAEISGTHGFNITAPAAYIVVQGFKFIHASGRNTIAGGASHVRFTRNTFQCSGDGPYLTVTGDDAEIDYNEFRDKKTLGNMISVTGTGSQVARGLWIHHNYFHDFANAHGNGAETIRFGLSGLSMSTGGGRVENNMFVRCVGENELISNKSC